MRREYTLYKIACKQSPYLAERLAKDAVLSPASFLEEWKTCTKDERWMIAKWCVLAAQVGPHQFGSNPLSDEHVVLIHGLINEWDIKVYLEGVANGLIDDLIGDAAADVLDERGDWRRLSIDNRIQRVLVSAWNRAGDNMRPEIEARLAAHNARVHEHDKAAARAYYASDHEFSLAYFRDFRARNHDVIAAQKAAYDARNREKCAAKSRAHYARNAEAIRARRRQSSSHSDPSAI